MRGEGPSGQVSVPALPLTGCVTLDKALHFSEPSGIVRGTRSAKNGCSVDAFYGPPADMVIVKSMSKMIFKGAGGEPGPAYPSGCSISSQTSSHVRGSQRAVCPPLAGGRVLRSAPHAPPLEPALSAWGRNFFEVPSPRR